MHAGIAPSTIRSRRIVCPHTYHTFLPSFGLETFLCSILFTSSVPTGETPTMGRRLTHYASITIRWLDNLGNQLGSFLKDPWMVLGDIFPDVSNKNMLVYDFRTSDLNFILNEHVKLYKTCIEIFKFTQVHQAPSV